MEEAEQFGLSVVEYELPTKIGYWDEKLALMYEKMDLIKKKRGRCETLTIRKNLLFENLFKKKKLREPNLFVHYGDAIQIASDKLQTEVLGIKPVVLAAIITEKCIDATLNLCHGCPITASLNKDPVLRNVMTIVDPMYGRSAERITYGNDVYICMHDSGSERILYLRAAVSTFDDFGGSNEHYPLWLCECPDRYCKFKIVHYNPDMRDVSIGDDVPSNTPICIRHTVTNRFLVTENNFMPTLFGAEMEVACYIYKEGGKETAANYWELAIEKQKSIKDKK